jgi:hypothetical protein
MFSIIAASVAFSAGIRESVNDSPNTPVIVETVETANQADTGENSTTTITGRVQIYGNEPHTFVGIIDHQDGIEYAVYPPSQEEALRGLQGRLIEFTVVKQDEPMGLGGLQLKGGAVTVVEWRIIR